MSMHSVRKCPECGKEAGLFVDSRGSRAIWQCINKHRFVNEKGQIGKRVKNAKSTMIQFKH